jgi:hypothetical protein
MKQSQFSEYERYLLMAHKSGLQATYASFLNFKNVISLMKQVASKTDDTFLYNGTIYKKKITSSEARSLLDGIFRNRCNKRTLRIVASQLKIRI